MSRAKELNEKINEQRDSSDYEISSIAIGLRRLLKDYGKVKQSGSGAKFSLISDTTGNEYEVVLTLKEQGFK